MNTDGITILFVPSGTSRIAATRYRIYQYLPYLEKHNIKYRVFSIISDATTKEMIYSPVFKGPRKIIYYLRVVLDKIIRLLPVLFLARKYKIIFLQRATLPFGLERILAKINPNIVFDIDDAIFMSDKEEVGLIARIKGYTKSKEVASILKVSRLAIVENEYIRDYVKKYCSNNILIPGPIDTERFFLKEKSAQEEVVIGWIGSPSTAVYLDMLKDVFRMLAKNFEVKIKLIGAGIYKLEGIDIINVPWAYDTEVAELQSFDIGVMPMPDNEWTRGKLGCKMLQYMAVGVPAVVSHTPTNAEVIIDGKNGFLINSQKEWLEKMSRLIKDHVLRQETGLCGRRTVEDKFSVLVNAPKLKEALEKLSGG